MRNSLTYILYTVSDFNYNIGNSATPLSISKTIIWPIGLSILVQIQKYIGKKEDSFMVKLRLKNL